MTREEFLEQEIEILSQQVRPSATGHIRTAISVLERELDILRFGPMIPDVKEQQLEMPFQVDASNKLPVPVSQEPELIFYKAKDGPFGDETIHCYGRPDILMSVDYTTYYVICARGSDDFEFNMDDLTDEEYEYISNGGGEDTINNLKKYVENPTKDQIYWAAICELLVRDYPQIDIQEIESDY